MTSTAIMPAGASTVARTAQAAPAAVRNTSLTPVKQAFSSSRQQPVSQQSTPQSAQQTPQQTPQQRRASPAVSTPGQWQHPRMEEVLRRQNATTFSKTNVFHITYCVCALLLSVIIPHFASKAIPASLTNYAGHWPQYVLLFVRAVITGSALLHLKPLLLSKDACEDIPLTPSQRHMLGLPPSKRPETAADQANYITPPRYSRSSTPRSTNSLRAHTSGSPLTGSPADFGSSQQRPSNGSPYSPSPLATKSYESGFASRRESVGGLGTTRRLSYGGSPRGSPSSLNLSEFEAAGNIGSPSKGNKASVGLNSKWLYEKGRRSPSGNFNVSRGPTMFT